MKLSTLNGKLKLCSVGANAKLAKGDSDTEITLSLSLAPATMGGRGDVCAHRSVSCTQFCLGPYSGRGIFNNVRMARARKTQLFFDDNALFKEQLFTDVELFLKYCKEHSLTGYLRLNIASDIDWTKIRYKEKGNKNLFELFPTLNFYDYTKDLKRVSKHSNYKLTYSFSEETTEEQLKVLFLAKKNVAVVFDIVPSFWNGIPVIDGDKTDLRYKDPDGVIVGLSPKGSLLKKAIKNNTDNGFVVRLANLNHTSNKILIKNV